MTWCCRMGALVGGVFGADQPFSAVGDVHRDFKAKTHFGIGRRGPLHVQSPEFRVGRADADTAMSGIPRDKGASCMPRDPTPAAMAPSNPGTLRLDMGDGLVAARGRPRHCGEPTTRAPVCDPRRRRLACAEPCRESRQREQFVPPMQQRVATRNTAGAVCGGERADRRRGPIAAPPASTAAMSRQAGTARHGRQTPHPGA